jgi:hypothetical protein
VLTRCGMSAAAEAASQSVAVQYEHRAAPAELKRLEVIDSVIDTVPRPPHSVKLKGADKTISVQVSCPHRILNLHCFATFKFGLGTLSTMKMVTA